MTETATATTDVKPLPAAPGVPPPAATEPTPTTAGDLIDLDHDTDDDAGGEGEEAAPASERQPTEKPAWARPDDPDAAEAWREERGVPLDASDYDLPVTDEAQSDPTFKQTLEGFTKLAHGLDLPQEGAAKLYEFVQTRSQEIMAARVEQDRAEAASAKQTLAEQWGDNAGANLKSVNALLKSLPSNLSKSIRDARSGNGLGSRLANEPAFLAMLSEYAALKAGGPIAGIFDGQADEKRIREIKRQRSDDVTTYFRHGLSEELATLEARQAARLPGQEGPRPNDAAREAEIKAAMRNNFEEYTASSMPTELAAIYKRRGAI